jgi:hypothetical protein
MRHLSCSSSLVSVVINASLFDNCIYISSEKWYSITRTRNIKKYIHFYCKLILKSFSCDYFFYFTKSNFIEYTKLNQRAADLLQQNGLVIIQILLKVWFYVVTYHPNELYFSVLVKQVLVILLIVYHYLFSLYLNNTLIGHHVAFNNV